MAGPAVGLGYTGPGAHPGSGWLRLRLGSGCSRNVASLDWLEQPRRQDLASESHSVKRMSMNKRIQISVRMNIRIRISEGKSVKHKYKAGSRL